MPTYGTTSAPYGTVGQQYGRAGRAAAVQAYADVYGGFPASRVACPALWQADASSWAGLAELGPWQDAQRTAILTDGYLQEDTLTFQVADVPAGRYYPGGADAAVLAPGALLRPQWTVTTPAGTRAWWGLPYRVRPVPVGPRDALGPGLIPVEAEDWCRANLAAWLPIQQLGPWRTLLWLKGAQLLAGMPTALGTDTLGALVLAVCWWASGGKVHVDAAWQTPPHVTEAELDAGTPADAPSPLQGDGFTGRDALAYLTQYLPFRVRYAADGWLSLQGGTARRDSGWALRCAGDDDVGGPFDVPFEDLTPGLQQAEYTSVHVYWLTETPAPGGTAIDVVPHAAALSTHPRLPDTGPYARPQAFYDRVAPGSSVHTADGARALLARYLGAADTPTVTLDSAIPAPPLGDEIYVDDPPRAQGWYAVQQIGQPFGPGPQTWSLSWRAGGA